MVQKNVALKDWTTFKIGGPAKYFVKVSDKDGLLKAIQTAVKLKVPFFILGGGSNVLIADSGFDGLVIKLEEGAVEFDGNKIKVFSGNNWPRFVRQTVEAGFSGLEFGANIPGTVGGAIFGNAGAYGKGAGDFVESVEIIDASALACPPRILNQTQCGFAYRESIFKKNKNWIIIEVIFELEKDDRAPSKLVQIKNEYNTRCAKQPLDFSSAGCSFKNVIYHDGLGQFKNWAQNGKIPAAKFIEEAGLKGKKIGGAIVSDKHANFILNIGEATADDVVQLIDFVKKTVSDKFRVELEEEVQKVGFK